MAEAPEQLPSPEAADAREEPWLTRGVAGIGIASLVADAGHEIPTTLLPSLLTSTPGASAAALAVIEVIFVAAVIAALLDEPGSRHQTLELVGRDSPIAAAVRSAS